MGKYINIWPAMTCLKALPQPSFSKLENPKIRFPNPKHYLPLNENNAEKKETLSLIKDMVLIPNGDYKV
jgi:hypothetical protein